MAESYANDVETTLNGSIDASTTTVVVTSATGFPSSGNYRIRVDDEIMLVTGGQGTTSWTVTRAIEDAARFPAASHGDTAAVTHVLTVAGLQNLVGGGASPAARYDAVIDNESSLVSHFKFGEPSGSTAYDHDGSNDLTLSSATLGYPGVLSDDTALAMSGAGEAADTSPSGLPTGASARTVECWYRGTSTSKQTLISYGTASTRQSFSLAINGAASPQVGYWTYADDANYSAPGLLDGNWHHLALTYDGSTTITVYFDGAVIGTGTLGGSLNTTVSGAGLVIGHDHFQGASYLNGVIDEAAIYSAELTQADIQAHIAASTVQSSSLPPLWSPDINSHEYEFASPLSGWTDLGSPTKNANTSALSHLYLKRASSAGIERDGIYRAIPSTPFTITAKLTDVGHETADSKLLVALFLGEASPGKFVTAGYYADSRHYTVAELWTNRTTYSAQHGTIRLVPGLPMYIRMVANSTTSYDAYVSIKGLNWVPLVTGQNPSFTIGSFGLLVGTYNNPSIDAEAYFDWLDVE